MAWRIRRGEHIFDFASRQVSVDMPSSSKVEHEKISFAQFFSLDPRVVTDGTAMPFLTASEGRRESQDKIDLIRSPSPVYFASDHLSPVTERNVTPSPLNQRSRPSNSKRMDSESAQTGNHSILDRSESAGRALTLSSPIGADIGLRIGEAHCTVSSGQPIMRADASGVPDPERRAAELPEQQASGSPSARSYAQTIVPGRVEGQIAMGVVTLSDDGVAIAPDRTSGSTDVQLLSFVGLNAQL